MNCPNCQQPVISNAKFCAGCGQAVGAAAGPDLPGVSAGGAPAMALGGGGFGPAAAAPPGGDNTTTAAAGLLARIQGIVLSPKVEWPVIAREATPVAKIISTYVVPLTLLVVIVTFVRMSVVGISMPFGGTIRTPFLGGLTNALVSFVMSLVGVGIVSLIINFLAPTFGGLRDNRKALQVAAYSLTPAYLSVVFGLLPALGTLLSFVAGLYGIYVLYLGLPVVMRSKPDKAVGYTASVVICTIIVGVVLGALSAAIGIGRGAGLAGLTGPSDRELAREQGAATVANALGGMLGTDEKGKANMASALSNLAKTGEQMSNDAASAGSRAANSAADAAASAGAGAGAAASAASTASADSAQNQPNPLAAAGGLMAAMGGALGGSHPHDPVDFHKLEALLPASLPGMSRVHAEGSAKQAIGVKGTSATATYRGDGGARQEIQIADATGVSGLMDLAGSLAGTTSSESDTGYEKDVTIGGHTAHEKYDRNSKHGELSVIVAKRFTVDVTGDAVSMEDLERSLGQVDLGALDGMKEAGANAR
jgi:Yip1 domain